MKLKVLLACEESQAVTKEFRKLGHEAYSCDLLPTSGKNKKWHIQDDVFNVIERENWDLMIAFPPCTHLAVSGARHFDKKKKDGRQKESIKFFKSLTKTSIKYWIIENPVGIMSTVYKKPNQIIHPYYFGDPYSKKTCLWFSKGLSNLNHYSKEDKKKDKSVKVTHTNPGEFVTFPSGKRMPKWYSDASNNGFERSKTFPGIAKAMAVQFSEQILKLEKSKK